MDLGQHLTSLPVLSVRQPWASYLAASLKIIELRSWLTSYKGWLWIHAGKKIDPVAMRLLDLSAEDFSCGGLIGLANLEECLTIDSETQWLAYQGEHLSPGGYSGPCFGWRFSDAIALPDIIKCQGELRLFHLSRSVAEQTWSEIKIDHSDFARVAGDALCHNKAVAP